MATATQDRPTFLRTPRPTAYSAAFLNEWIDTGALTLDNEYQREGVVWSEKKQSAFIASLLENYYVQPIVFAIDFEADGNETRLCVDGKQRLLSIRRFMIGEICYKDRRSNKKFYYNISNGSSQEKHCLSPGLMSTFKHRQICCVEYDSITPSQQREIYLRVHSQMEE